MSCVPRMITHRNWRTTCCFSAAPISDGSCSRRTCALKPLRNNGNVMGSRGSVIPFFKSRRQDGVLPITDERMTRFSITLQEGVDFVLDSFGRMWGGEIFVPRIPSYRILDVAKAIAPEAKLEFIGIRPGEKLHEEMVSEDDAIATIDFGDYFVILPSTYQWDEEKFRLESGPKQGTRCEYGFRYSSGTNDRFLAVDELESLIAQEVDI